MTTKAYKVTVGSSVKQTGGKPSCTIGAALGDLVTAASNAVALTTSTVGGMTTTQIGSVQTSATQLSGALSADVLVNINKATVTTKTQVKAALEAVARSLDGAGDFSD